MRHRPERIFCYLISTLGEYPYQNLVACQHNKENKKLFLKSCNLLELLFFLGTYGFLFPSLQNLMPENCINCTRWLIRKDLKKRR